MNKMINANRYSRYSGGDLKRAWTARIAAQIRAEKMVKLDNGPYWFDFVWYAPSKRTDPDNISSSGMKLIFDGMMKANVLKNDGWSEVNGFTHNFEVDKQDPRVEIVISKK